MDALSLVISSHIIRAWLPFENFSAALISIPAPLCIPALLSKTTFWPVSALRVAAKAQEELYAALRRDGDVSSVLDRMLTRQELYERIGYAEYEALDAAIIKTVIP